MKSDGRCTVVVCKDRSIRLLASLTDAGFVQVRGGEARADGHHGNHVLDNSPGSHIDNMLLDGDER